MATSATRPVIALLHGGGQGSWVWEELVALLEQAGVRAIALDVPGCGTKRGRDLSAIDANCVAAELVDDLSGHDDVTLVGHSLAGAILPRMAGILPNKWRRLIYVTCTAPPTGTGFRALMGSGLHGENPDEVGWPVDPASTSADERYRVMFCNDMSRENAGAFLAKMGQDDWPMDVLVRTDHKYDHLAEIPSTYIVCQRDNGLPPNWQRKFAKRLHCDRIREIDAGHQVMVTQPAKLAEMLLVELS
ncbi:alpha/beta fold hydrolase [Pontixanthobacter aquaemixtae]|uniref:Alpha/beta fold hydrolase n=1 Tax=Pontixanthobacter aquaemixtae TaxID=1958940 RepID=A0A844ZSL9_9SPHN|nr:alpha/beta hydrolase [Pontixanthobacter aquaemixtae]MXO89996.1 alpha/beta fold hydrolase [Pontixanthobacter aquaemixtae]